MLDFLARWLAERTGASALVDKLRERRVGSWSAPHYLGGLLFMVFLLEVASGILLMLPYRSDPVQAHASVVAIAGRLPYGSLVRGVHAWSSQMFLLLLFVHMAVTVLQRSYREPNELLWWTGLAMLVVGLNLAFTGAMLPWSQNAYLQARVSSDMLGHGPIFGPWLKRMLRGGEDLTPWSLNHAYGFHIGVLPALATFLFGAYWAFSRRGASERVEGPTIRVYPDFAVRLAAACTLVLGVIISLATFAPVAVGTPANLLTGPAAGEIKPPWYFLFLHDLLRSAPPRLLGLESPQFILGALSLLFLFVVALPFIDRRGSKITAYVGAVLLVVFVVLTSHAAL